MVDASSVAEAQSLPVGFRVHDLSRRWVEYQMAGAFVAVGGAIALLNFNELAACNWTPFIPPNGGEGRFGVDGIMRASSIVF